MPKFSAFFSIFAYEMVKERIEYIDAMRGFTMILVVYSHVCNYCLGNKWMGWNDVFFLFRLPCFFFISGYLFEKVGRQWDNISVKFVIWHKFMVQIVPTIIFLLLLAPPPLFFSKLGATKGGYWFTIALFEFFLICIFSERYMKRWGGAFALAISVAAFCYDIYYHQFVTSSHNLQLSILNYQFSITDVLGFMSVITWRYYLFFYLGTWVKRHFDEFIRWTGKTVVVITVVVCFVIIAWNPHSENMIGAYLVFAFGGILGLTMVFTAFRSFSGYLTKDSWLGRGLQYIGTRTLDIYLLHYFFLPRFLLVYAPQLSVDEPNRPLEFIVAITLALVVVTVCLLVSYIIRLNAFLGHYLFGVKRN